MKCETFENYLDGYLDGSLSELEQQAMQEHMQNCPGCRKRYEEQRLLLEELRHLDDGVRAPEGLVAGTMSASAASASRAAARGRTGSAGASRPPCA